VRVVHTAHLARGELHAIRTLLDGAFDDMTDEDYEHALGGLHALIWDGPELIAHGSVVMRRLVHDRRAIRTGYVEAVAVRPDRQRQGHGGRLMDALEEVIRGAYELGALGASDAGAAFYASRGWALWKGATYVLAPSGVQRTEAEDGCIYVLPITTRLSRTGDLACDWREGDVW
jgi:aminoglycoside 2'-N-acetyltransferase I